MSLEALSSADRILVQQVFKPIANEYRISIPEPGSSEEGEQVLYVKQKKLKIKEDIRFRPPGQEDGPHLFMIKAKSVFEFRGRYDVLDASDQPIGTLQKDFKKSLIRSHWTIRDASEAVVARAQESSIVRALLRRFGGLLPDYLSWIVWIPFNFTIYKGETEEEIGTYNRVFGKLRDRYVYELSPEAGGIDRRLLVALSVGLDALQDR